MIAYLLSKLITMVYGMLYPAYCSYKAIKTKDVKEYVHWMMYWIVFSIFSFFEVFADTFIGCWFPFYYELKILFMVWMLAPGTRGGSILYRRLIHPSLTRHEPEIDAYLAEFKLRTSNLIVQWGAKAFSYITDLMMTTAMRAGAGDYRFMNKVTRTYSYEDFGQADMNRNNKEIDSPMSDSDTTDNSFQGRSQEMAVNRRFAPPADIQYGSVEGNLGSFGNMSKPYSMMNLSDQSESQQPPKTRSSSRKKKEFGNFPAVAQDMSMPLVFGWYPPNMTSSFMPTSSFPYQDLSQMVLPPHIRRDLVLSPSSFQWIHDQVPRSTSNLTEGSSESESESFFDCDTSQDLNVSKTVTEKANIKPIVKMVSKTVLQEFEGNDVKLRSKEKSPEKLSSSDAKKRNSMSSISKPSSSQPQKTVVKKSLSNSDLIMTKAPIISSSSFRRVFSPFSPKPVSRKSKRTNTYGTLPRTKKTTKKAGY